MDPLKDTVYEGTEMSLVDGGFPICSVLARFYFQCSTNLEIGWAAKEKAAAFEGARSWNGKGVCGCYGDLLSPCIFFGGTPKFWLCLTVLKSYESSLIFSSGLITNALSFAGLTHTPRSDKSEVTFNPKDPETYLPYTKALKDFLAKYNDNLQKESMYFEDCGGRF